MVEASVYDAKTKMCEFIRRLESGEIDRIVVKRHKTPVAEITKFNTHARPPDPGGVGGDDITVNGVAYEPVRYGKMARRKSGALFDVWHFSCCNREWAESRTCAGQSEIGDERCPYCGARLIIEDGDVGQYPGRQKLPPNTVHEGKTVQEVTDSP